MIHAHNVHILWHSWLGLDRTEKDIHDERRAGRARPIDRLIDRPTNGNDDNDNNEQPWNTGPTRKANILYVEVRPNNPPIPSKHSSDSADPLIYQSILQPRADLAHHNPVRGRDRYSHPSSDTQSSLPLEDSAGPQSDHSSPLPTMPPTTPNPAMNLEQALANLRSCYSREDILEHWNVLQRVYLEQATDTSPSFMDWVLEGDKVGRPVILLVGERLFQDDYTQLSVKIKALVSRLTVRLGLQSNYELCFGLGMLVIRSRDSMKLLIRVAKKQPQITFLEILRELRNARDTLRKRKQGSRKDMSQFVMEDVKNAMKSLLPPTPTTPGLSSAKKHDGESDVEDQARLSDEASMSSGASDIEADPPGNGPLTTDVTTQNIPSTTRHADYAEDLDNDREQKWSQFSTNLIQNSHVSTNPQTYESSAYHSRPTSSRTSQGSREGSQNLDDTGSNMIDPNDDAAAIGSQFRDDSYEADVDDSGDIVGEDLKIGLEDVTPVDLDVEQPRRAPIPGGAGYDFEDVLSENYGLPNSVSIRKTTSTPSVSNLSPQPAKSFTPHRTEVLEWGDDSTVLINGMQIQAKDFECLTGKAWLNDEIINAMSYLQLLNCPDVYLMSSFFFFNLAGKGQPLPEHEIDYDAVRKWTQKRNVDIFSYKYLVVPMNTGNAHWKLAVIANVSSSVSANVSSSVTGGTSQSPAFRIFTLDSMDPTGKHDNFLVYRKLAAYLLAEGTSNNYPVCQEHIVWKHATKLPQQLNSWDCGVYVLAYLSHFAKDPRCFCSNIQQNLVDSWQVDAVEVRTQIKMRLLARKAEVITEVSAATSDALTCLPSQSDNKQSASTTTDTNILPEVSVVATTKDSPSSPTSHPKDPYVSITTAFATSDHNASRTPADLSLLGTADSVLGTGPKLISTLIAESADSSGEPNVPEETTSRKSSAQTERAIDELNHSRGEKEQSLALAELQSHIAAPVTAVLHQGSILAAIMEFYETSSKVQQFAMEDVDTKASYAVSEADWAFLLHADSMANLTELRNALSKINVQADIPSDSCPQVMRKRYDDLSAAKALELERRFEEEEANLQLIRPLVQLLQSVLEGLESTAARREHLTQTTVQDLQEQKELRDSGLSDRRMARYREQWIQNIDDEISKLCATAADLEQVKTELLKLYQAALTLHRNSTRLQQLYADSVEGLRAEMQSFIEKDLEYERERQRPAKRLQMRLAAREAIGEGGPLDINLRPT